MMTQDEILKLYNKDSYDLRKKIAANLKDSGLTSGQCIVVLMLMSAVQMKFKSQEITDAGPEEINMVIARLGLSTYAQVMGIVLDCRMED